MMIDTFNLQKAIKVATNAHDGQKSRNGADYIAHPLTVMDMMQDDDTKIVAVLHDVVEDTKVGIDELRAMGCPQHILDAVLLVTHEPEYNGTDEEYMVKIQKIADSGNQMAIDVKWGDLTHNSDMSRIPEPTKKDFQRREKYQKSKEILRPLVSEYLTLQTAP